MTHGVVKFGAEDRGTVAVDIFRLEDGRVVEHWDVPAAGARGADEPHPMF